MNILEKFRKIASQKKFNGWPMVGNYRPGRVIPWFGQVLNYTLSTGNGEENYVSLIRHFGWSMVFGVTGKNKVITLVQWKPGVNRATWELPPGGIGKVGLGASISEIREKTRKIYLKETGYGKGRFKYLGKAFIESAKYRGAGPDDHGLPAHMFLATGLKLIKGARQPNRNEIIEILEVPLKNFPKVIASGEFNEVSGLPCALLALMKLGELVWKK